MTYTSLLKPGLDAAREATRLRAKARCQKWLDACANANSDQQPNMDKNNRAHAPCDGYLFEDQIYNKGEFLHTPIEISEDMAAEGLFVNKPPKSAYKHKFKMKVTPRLAQELRGFSEEYRYKCDFGKSWGVGTTKLCYAYLETVNKDYQQELEKAIGDAMKGEENPKGTAPEGKQTVTARIASIKPVSPPLDSDGKQPPTVDKIFIVFDNQSTAYGTLPSNLEGIAKAGNTITMTATFSHAKEDYTHAFFRFPTNAIIKSGAL